MKSCPSCRKTYSDDTLNFCLNDGTPLVVNITADPSSAETVFMNRPQTAPTERFNTSPPIGAPQTYAIGQGPRRSRAWLWILLAVTGLMVLLVTVGGLAFYQYTKYIGSSVTDVDDTNTSPRRNSTSDVSKTLTKERYDRIVNGMTKTEIEKLLGSPGDEITSMETGLGKFTAYRWNGENSSYISVNFTNDKVMGKTQFGLEASPETANDTTTISLEKFQQIKNGMMRSDVEEILGEGTEISSTNSLGKTYSMYQWNGENFANIMVNFVDDKVTGKSQFGLGDKKTANVELTKANYDKIKNGMSLSDVEEIFGGPGDAVTDQSGDGDQSSSVYKWSGSEYAFVVVGFINGKVIYKSQNGVK